MTDTFGSCDAVGAPVSRHSDDPLRSTAPSIVVGLGNEIAGDDGVGIHVARVLEHRFNDTPDIEVVALPWAGLALLDVLRGRTRAAIVDCLISGNRVPGTVVRLAEGEIAGSVRLNSFHDISFPTALALGREMGWDMPSVVAIWGVEAERVDVFHEGLSPAVAAAVEPLAEEIARFINPAYSN
jgi:hydrogenase maturation protease